MFGISGAGLSKIRHWQNDGKRARHSVDQWDKVCTSTGTHPPMIKTSMKANSSTAKQAPHTCYTIHHTDCEIVMGRDMRLTGRLRGQTDNATAPFGFELNNPWKVSLLLAGDMKEYC